MLLLHQVGSLKTGEVVRYTITYVPSQDRILPSPEKLFLRVRNTSAIALRAAFVHGPYTLSAAAYPAGFNPNEKFEYPERYGVPEFEPMVKAGGSWECELVVPVTIRQSAGLGSHGGFGKGPSHDHESASWIVEVSSQILFSTSAAVGYEVVLARDKKSLSLSSSSPVVGGQSQVPQPGKVSDHQQGIEAKEGHHPVQPRGIFSRAIQIKVEDTAALWNTPRLPGWDDQGDERVKKRSGQDQHVESVVKTEEPETQDDASKPQKPKQKPKKVHVVVLTHGLHSNLGADMLFMKESIDAAVKQAKIDAKARRAQERAERKQSGNGIAESDSHDTKDIDKVEGENEEDDDDEEVIVRGYSGNSTKTERGIKYLGKRLARYVLSMTYPDQPFLPTGKGMSDAITHTFDKHDPQQKAVHKHSTIQLGKDGAHLHKAERPYKITSISFIAHSLGGLVQTYAIAYIQKHSPQFFDLIKPINFVALATPFLGLSNENPLYVKFALDSGLVGRTGKDLGLTWRAPTLARSGWGAIVGNLGETAHKKVYGEAQPESKPLLRILPTGPAHTALKKFRNRTVYSNVVNDGIVPLRTSCLLFLDWQGLGRVEKARRDAGLVETVVGFGWAELTGSNQAISRQKQLGERSAGQSGTSTPQAQTHENMREVPQPPSTAMVDDDRASLRSVATPYGEEVPSDSADSTNSNSGPLAGFFNFFKSNEPPKPPNVSLKQKRIYSKSQTLADGSVDNASDAASKQSKVTSGHEGEDEMTAPPRTTIFESAGDLLNPKMPDVEYLIDPSKRPRTIFHDRVYHPADIPGPPLKRRPSTLVRRKTGQRQNSLGQASVSSAGSFPYPSVNHEDSSLSAKDYDDTGNTNPDKDIHEVIDTSNMRVEEKIARAYHKDLSWRKVLVKVEPDAHNNVFVRRMFANAYGWPVVKHMVDAHFSDSTASRLRDEDEHSRERARNMNEPPDEHGAELKKSRDNLAGMTRTDSETREALDKVSDLPKAPKSQRGSDASMQQRPKAERADSVSWSDRDWHDSDCDSDLDFGGDLPAPTSPEALHQQDKGKEAQGSSGGWNWAEKIVGKGATRAKSPVHGGGSQW
ncbi:hypothetical protein F53441_3007 [Fusarium austroafricanum]|uniref:DUF676 domain-containing protein n=1 Tax=Fusarium austroafricanum TaxID=2364996 RepID=A0A8H4P2A7_9HYPO|nr:hypothetical protein F53441_3007 [Fusarium austroafricanum]